MAFWGFHSATDQGLFTGTGGPLSTIADSQGGFFFNSASSPAINARGTVAFSAHLATGGQGIFTGSGGPVTKIADTSAGFVGFGGGPAINARGEVAFLALLNPTSVGLFTGPDPLADKVLTAGDSLFGLSFGRTAGFSSVGLNDAGQLAFYAELGSKAVIVRADPRPTPFAAFTATLELALGPRIDDTFVLQSTVTLGTSSDSIDLAQDPVTLRLTGGTGAFTTTIPAGSFTKDKQGRFTFAGTISDVKLEATMTPLGGRRYAFQAEGEHADLTGTANPVTVTLTIGDDSSSTTVTAQFKHHQDERD